MSKVLAAGSVFAVEDYEARPEAFGEELERAKVEHGHALCLCTVPNPQLVIRRVGSPNGDRFFLATWPHKGTGHAPTCRFFHSEDEYEETRARRLAAVQQSEEGFTIKADFSLLRRNGAPEPQPRPAPAAASGVGGQRQQRDTLTLLATLEFLWRTAGLNQYIPGSVRRWPEITRRLTSVLEQGALGGRKLASITYLVPPYEPAAEAEAKARFAAMLEQFRRTSEVTPSFLVLAEIKEVAGAKNAVRTRLRHHPAPVFMFPSLARALAARYPIAEAQLVQATQRPDEISGRVVGLFLVEVTDRGGLWARDAALLTCCREFVPCDSSYEVDLANRMTRAGRTFVKPMAMDLEDDTLPDFIALDTSPPVPMEVWGMNTEAYVARKQAKRALYAQRGAPLWEWEAWRDAQPPDLPR